MVDNKKIVIDVAERKKLEEELKINESRFKTLFESSGDAIMTLEPPAWRFTFGNPAALKMFMAKDEAEFSSAEPWKLSPEKQPDGRFSADKAKEMIETAMRVGSNFFEWTHKRLNGEDFPATVLLTRVELPTGVFLQATVRDITAQKLAENSLKLKNEELEKMNKFMVDRELKMVELKKEMSELKAKLEGK